MRIEIPGRLVGENDFWARDDSASDCGALLLATRELERHVVFFFFEVEAVKNFGGAKEATGFVIARVDEGEGNVFYDREVGD